VTAAALVMSISFAALIAAQVSFMRMFGTGLTLAVLADATLVRMVLVPAFMHVLGHWSWWAPKPLVWLHDRFGISESDSEPLPMSADPAHGRHRRSDEDSAIPAGASSGGARTGATVVDGR
jgi:RND superfamily putative drug exporter